MVKIALVGKKAVGKTFVAYYLRKQYGFKVMRMSEGVSKLMRFFYMYGKWKRPKWERKIDIYDALYKIDPTIHLNYFLRRLSTTKNDVVVDDVRYVSELSRLKEEGFIIVRVVSPESRRRKIGTTVRAAEGGTLVLQEYFGKEKTAAYKADYAVFNDTREGTRRAVDQIMLEILDK